VDRLTVRIRSGRVTIFVGRVRKIGPACNNGRAFAVASGTVWNSLRDTIRDLTINSDGFRRVLKLTVSPDPFPRSLPLSNGLISRFLSSTCTEVSGVENLVSAAD